MAFEVKKIDPLDLQPRVAIGVGLPFSGKAVFNSIYTSAEAIKNNLINYFLTGKGERYMNPTFGNGLQSLLFDQLTEQKVVQIDAIIKADLEFYFPRVQVVNIETVGDPDTNTVSFYGMSSKEAQGDDFKDYRASEGRVVRVNYKGSVEPIVRDILGGLRSSCTYVGASALKELPKRTTFVRIASGDTHNRIYESSTTGE